MAFTKQELQKYLNMIRIDIPDEELDAMNANQVWEWMAQMKKTDTEGIEPMYTPATHPTPIREDIVTETNTRAEILANTPDKSGVASGYFAVPKVIGE